jgi:hypothetical protein
MLTGSVANSLQNFPASPGEKFNRSGNTPAPSSYHFLKAFGHKKRLS